jgi:hypothetical protein
VRRRQGEEPEPRFTSHSISIFDVLLLQLLIATHVIRLIEFIKHPSLCLLNQPLIKRNPRPHLENRCALVRRINSMQLYLSSYRTSPSTVSLSIGIRRIQSDILTSHTMFQPNLILIHQILTIFLTNTLQSPIDLLILPVFFHPMHHGQQLRCQSKLSLLSSQTVTLYHTC